MYTEMFDIELFICMKMDLALNNLQRLICHKTLTNQTSVSSQRKSKGQITCIQYLTKKKTGNKKWSIFYYCNKF